jgi:hypothetical protein
MLEPPEPFESLHLSRAGEEKPLHAGIGKPFRQGRAMHRSTGAVSSRSEGVEIAQVTIKAIVGDDDSSG